MRVNLQLHVEKLFLEKPVSLQKNGKSVSGSFDFFVQSNGKQIGFEVLTRPTKGKLKEKLAYANNVDEFVFVLPKDSLNFYQKPKTKIFHKQSKPCFFEHEFRNPKLYAWVFDLKTGTFEKGKFDKIFNVC